MESNCKGLLGYVIVMFVRRLDLDSVKGFFGDLASPKPYNEETPKCQNLKFYKNNTVNCHCFRNDNVVKPTH